MKQFLYILIVGFLFSCTNHEEYVLREALKKSGSNRPELETVLDYYRDDDRKLKAAKFLIANMPFHYSQVSGGLTGKVRELYELSQSMWKAYPDNSVYRSATLAFDSLKKLPDNIYLLEFNTVNDINTISSEYLIRNIDMAFEVWDKVPWKEQFTLEYFCKNMLPYRVYNEALTDWREIYIKEFGHVLDSLPRTEDSYIIACQKLCDAIEEKPWFHVDEFIGSWVDALTLLENRFGSCREEVTFVQYAMRALCIPGSVDIILQRPDKMYPAHYWVQFPDLNGHPVEFGIHNEDLRPIGGLRNNIPKKGVVYRICYDMDIGRLPLKYGLNSLPKKLREPLLKDVTSEYFPSHRIEIEIPKQYKGYSLVLLGVFNNRDWIPVTATGIEKGIACFSCIEPGIVYMPLLFRNGQTQYFSSPFLLQGDGKIHYWNSDPDYPVNVDLYRKHPLPSSLEYLKRFLVGGVFQGANRADFSDAYDLFRVDDHNDLMVTRVSCDTDKVFRYVRYLSATEGRCNMAEIKFYDSYGNQLKGNITGTSGSFQNHPSRTIHAVFDDDPLTFYNAKEQSGAWVGLDLEKKYCISEIEYQFRNDDNLIRKGELYELFYFTNEGPISLGRQYGTGEPMLHYKNVPGNTLLWLRNHSKGREERIFTYEDGKQVWW